MTNISSKYKLVPYLMIAPAFVLIFLFKLYPIFTTVWDSLYLQEGFTTEVYSNLFHDKIFWNSLWVTIKFNLFIIPIQIIIAFGLALLVNTTVKGVGVFRSIIYIPVAVSLTVACVLWNMMLNPNSGIINSILVFFGIPAQGFLIDKSQALWCIILIASWKGISYWMMFILAGLKNIDESIYESAKIDGAGWLRTIFSITLPLLKRVMLFVLVANTTANILLFAPVQMLTKGGPENSTNLLMYESYKSAFMFADRSRSAAIVTVLLVIIILICFLQFLFLSDKDDVKDMKKMGRRSANEKI